MISEEELTAIEARLQEAAPGGIVDMGAKATHDLVETDVPALIEEVRRLHYELDAHKEHLRFAIQRAHAEKF